MEQEAFAGSPPAQEGSATGGSLAGTEAGVGSSPEPSAAVEAGGQRQSEHVPYERFQQVNTRLSTLNRQAQDAGYSSAEEYLEALQSAQAQPGGYGYQPEPDPYAGEYVDPALRQMQQQLAPVLEFTAQAMFEKQFSAAKAAFPLADEQDVRTALLSGQARSVQAAAQASHQRMETLRQRFLGEYQEQAAKRSDAGVEGAGGGSTSGGIDYSKMPAAEFREHQKRVRGY